MTINADKHTLHLGNFHSERFWRNPAMAELPAIPDPQADAIVSTMDEMLFTACHTRDDLLLTRQPINAVHKQYLQDNGLHFTCNEKPISTSDAAICAALLSSHEQTYFDTLLRDMSNCKPYAVLPSMHDFCQHYGIPQSFPKIATVNKVNSKLFSHQLAVEILGEVHGEIIYSAQELATTGERLLANTPFLIKDDLGVSGKGNLFIESPQLLARVVRHLSQQESKGKKTCFLLEPLLDKEMDFSCQLHIDCEGKVDIVSIQKMDNAGFAFAAIQSVDQEFISYLERIGYLCNMEVIAAQLYREGYFGPVCVDSMLLQNGTIRTIVEINARQSMGFINHYVDRFLQDFDTQSSLLFFSLGVHHGVNFTHLLERMQQADILFSKDKPEGILPLSANTLTANLASTPEGGICKGRLYASIVAQQPSQRAIFKTQMQQVFTDLGVKVYN